MDSSSLTDKENMSEEKINWIALQFHQQFLKKSLYQSDALNAHKLSRISKWKRKI